MTAIFTRKECVLSDCPGRFEYVGLLIGEACLNDVSLEGSASSLADRPTDSPYQMRCRSLDNNIPSSRGAANGGIAGGCGVNAKLLHNPVCALPCSHRSWSRVSISFPPEFDSSNPARNRAQLEREGTTKLEVVEV